MRNLEDMSLGHRVMATAIIVVVVMLILACIGYLSGRWEVEAAPVPVLTPYDARLIELDREAIDNAYRSKVEQLFAVWLRDETGQPARAVVGVNQARKAYAGAMAEVDRRQRLQQ